MIAVLVTLYTILIIACVIAAWFVLCFVHNFLFRFDKSALKIKIIKRGAKAYIKASEGLRSIRVTAERMSDGSYQCIMVEGDHQSMRKSMALSNRDAKYMKQALCERIQAYHPEICIVEVLGN